MTSSEPSKTNPRKVAILWDTYGPQHVDRLNTVAQRFPNVLGVELFAQSDQYDWSWHPDRSYEHITFRKARTSPLRDGVMVIRRLVGLRFSRGIDVWLLCNYERLYIFITAWLLRLSGARVYIMQDSKFVDRPRGAWREAFKSIAYGPYNGALSAGAGTTNYLRFLGVKGPITEGYNTSSVARLRAFAATEAIAFEARPFLFVGRFIWEKNAPAFVSAYADYVAAAGPSPRKLVMIGSGPEEKEVRAIVEARGIGAHVEFIPWAKQPDVMRHMSQALYLFLPSVSETFGNVVGEAAVVGLPAIVSEPCGVRDQITCDFVSGFTLPADQPEAWSKAMLRIAQDEPLWRELSAGATRRAEAFDASHFLEAVTTLVQTDGRA